MLSSLLLFAGVALAGSPVEPALNAEIEQRLDELTAAVAACEVEATTETPAVTIGLHLDAKARQAHAALLKAEGLGDATTGCLTAATEGLVWSPERADRRGAIVFEVRQGVLTATRTAAPIILGSLEKSQIDQVIKDDIHRIHRCYLHGLARQPELAGRAVVKFVIAKDGRVTSAELTESELDDARVNQCLTDQFLRLRFPEPVGGGIVIVRYPVVFEP